MHSSNDDETGTVCLRESLQRGVLARPGGRARARLRKHSPGAIGNMPGKPPGKLAGAPFQAA